MRDLDLPRRHRLMGVPVLVMAGFDTRGSDVYDPEGGVNHHTAGPRNGVAPSLGVCTNGRSDLAGPLCQTLQDRDDVAREIASGRANHAGRGGWNGLEGNSKVFGLEIEFMGTTAEPFPAKRLDIAARIQAGAALGRYDAENVCQHFEWTGRKIDLLRSALGAGGADAFRNRVQWYIDHPPGLAPIIPKKNPPKLVKTLHVGMVDDPENEIIEHVENLLLWNAVKRGQPNRGPGKVDGKFTGKGGTAESLVYFRRDFFDFQKAFGARHPVFVSREFAGVDKGDYSQVAVGPKILGALEWAAAA